MNGQSCWATTASTTTATTPSAVYETLPIVTQKMHKSLFVKRNKGPFKNDVMLILQYAHPWLPMPFAYGEPPSPIA